METHEDKSAFKFALPVLISIILSLACLNISAQGTEKTDAKALSAVESKVVNFTAIYTSGKIYLFWTVKGYSNESVCMVERSKNGKKFETIGIKKGASLESKSLKLNYIDESPIGEPSFYRLVYVDKTGESVFSTVEKTFYINPEKKEDSAIETLTSISNSSDKFDNFKDGKYEYYDIDGQLLKEEFYEEGKLKVKKIYDELSLRDNLVSQIKVKSAVKNPANNTPAPVVAKSETLNKDGKYVYYDTDGQVIRHEIYIGGSLVARKEYTEKSIKEDLPKIAIK